jgi:Putative transposase
LTPLTLFNQELVFNLLFWAASRALLEFALGYERLQAQIGFTAVLHTWDQDLNFHPHLHIVATGGGLSRDASRWVPAPNSFLLPVRALSKIIRAKFVQTLQEAFRDGRLKGTVQCLEGSPQFHRFTRKLKRKKWVVYSKQLFNGSKKAYDYLSRHTHRVAISNHRLVSLDHAMVTFRARDNPSPGQHRPVTIHALEFIRRFLLHILPDRFVKIRHFGLMAPCNAKTKLVRARNLIHSQEPPHPVMTSSIPPGRLKLGRS